jgi:hypothetical protein
MTTTSVLMPVAREIPKNIVALDFETYYDDAFTLKKMPTSEYIRDKRFKAHGAAIRLPTETTSRWVSSTQLQETFAAIDWSQTALLAHHCQFDGLILSHHFGIHPMYMLCTMSMARALYSHDIGAILDEVAKFLGKGAKLRGALDNTKGKRELTPDEEQALAEYAIQDNDLAWAIFQEMTPIFPLHELHLIDITVRAFTDPVLKVNIPRAKAELKREVAHKQELITKACEILGAEDLKAAGKVLSSSDKFAAALEVFGVDVPLKWSDKQEKLIPALAKNDLEFQELEDHPDENVQALYTARLAVKSTIIETRAERLIDHARPALPIYLNYHRAHTGRWCMKPDSEILTPNGWVRMDAWAGEPIMQWDDYTLSWCATPLMNVFSYEGDLLRLNGRGIKGSFTPEHRIPAVTGRGNLLVKTADEAYRHDVKVPTGGEYDGTLSGLLWHESYQAPLDWELLEVPLHQKHEIINGLCTSSGVFLTNGSRKYFTTDRQNAEIVATLAHMSGSKATLHTRSGSKAALEPNVRYEVLISPRTHTSVRHSDWRREPYEGQVYCPTTDTGFFLVRVGDCIYVTGNSGGDKLNPQNFGRDSELRRCIKAPRGHRLVVVDSGQIEARVLAWLAGQEDLLDTFRAYDAGTGPDPYRTLAADIYNKQPEEIDKTERFVGKVCLAKGSFVLSSRGWIPIETLRATDQLWDGDSWQEHGGLISNGTKETIALCGLRLTPEHLVWTGTNWISAGHLLHNNHELFRALAYAKSNMPGYIEPYPTIEPNDSSELEVFDIACVGPKNRFFAWSERGPLVVHNCRLGLGYGMGAPKLQYTLETGSMGPPIVLPENECKRAVNVYRARSRQIVMLWDLLGKILTAMVAGNTVQYRDILTFYPDHVLQPNGLALHYPDLRATWGERGFTDFTYRSSRRGHRSKIYGGKFAENLVQALARIVVAEQGLRIADRYRVVLLVHDEVVLCVPTTEAKRALDFSLEQMTLPPAWAQGIPLAAEGGIGDNYGDAKPS